MGIEQQKQIENRETQAAAAEKLQPGEQLVRAAAEMAATLRDLASKGPKEIGERFSSAITKLQESLRGLKAGGVLETTRDGLAKMGFAKPEKLPELALAAALPSQDQLTRWAADAVEEPNIVASAMAGAAKDLESALMSASSQDAAVGAIIGGMAEVRRMDHK